MSIIGITRQYYIWQPIRLTASSCLPIEWLGALDDVSQCEHIEEKNLDVTEVQGESDNHKFNGDGESLEMLS